MAMEKICKDWQCPTHTPKYNEAFRRVGAGINDSFEGAVEDITSENNEWDHSSIAWKNKLTMEMRRNSGKVS